VRRPPCWRCVGVWLSLLAACDRTSEPTPTVSNSAARPSNAVASAAAPTPSSVPASSAEAAEATAPPPCRALLVKGAVTDTVTQTALRDGDAVSGHNVLELGAGAELALRFGSSGREWKLRGPAVVLPCRQGTEQLVVHSGVVHSTFGTGVRPGAEAWLLLPGVSVRYGDAELEATVAAQGASVRLLRGAAQIEPWFGPKLGKPSALKPPQLTWSYKGRPDVRRLVEGCAEAARAAEDSARAVLSANAQELGKLAAAQLRDRRLARSRCGAAVAAISPKDAGEDALRAELLQADQRWQAVPKNP